MGLVLASVLLVMLTWDLTGVSALRCGAFENHLGPHQCKNYVSDEYAYFIPDQTTATSPNETMTKDRVSELAFSTLYGLSLFSKKCRIPATRFVCSSAFQPCSINALSPSLPNFLVFPLPRSPCRSLCEAMVENCADEGIPLPNCTAIDPTTGQDAYPKNYTIWTVNGQKYRVPCNNIIPKLKSHDVVPLTCPRPTELKEDGYGEPPCAPPCLVVFSKDEYRVIELMVQIFGPISLACIVFITITWIMVREWRQFPANLFIYAFLSMVVAESDMTGTAISGVKKVVCHDHFTRATQDDWRCATQGALAQWCALCGGMAWTCISINIFLLVVVEMKPQNALKLQPLYVVAIFLMPSISILFIALPGSFMESNGVLAWCDAGAATQWVAQVPYAIQVLITLFCILSVVLKLLLTDRELLKGNIHLLMFLGVFVWVFTASVAISFYFYVHKEEWQQALVDYTRCNVAMRSDCEVESSPPFWPIVLITFAFCSAGLQILIVLMQRGIVYHWYAVVYYVRRGDWRALLHMSLAESKRIWDGKPASTMSAMRTSSRKSTTITHSPSRNNIASASHNSATSLGEQDYSRGSRGLE